MANVTIYHPETEGTVSVPEESVWCYRQAGWLLHTEHRENEALRAARAAERATAQAAATETVKSAAGKPAGGEAKEK